MQLSHVYTLYNTTLQIYRFSTCRFHQISCVTRVTRFPTFVGNKLMLQTHLLNLFPRFLLIPHEGMEYRGHVSTKGSAWCAALFRQDEYFEYRRDCEKRQQSRKFGYHHRKDIIVEGLLAQAKFLRIEIVREFQLLQIAVCRDIGAFLQEYL